MKNITSGIKGLEEIEKEEIQEWIRCDHKGKGYPITNDDLATLKYFSLEMKKFIMVQLNESHKQKKSPIFFKQIGYLHIQVWDKVCNQDNIFKT